MGVYGIDLFKHHIAKIAQSPWSLAPAPIAAVISEGVDTSPLHGLETDQFACRPPSREEVLEFTPRGVRYGVTVRSDR